MNLTNLKNMNVQLEDLWEKLDGKKITGYFHPSNRHIKRTDISFNEYITPLDSLINTEEAFIIEGWVLIENENKTSSIHICRDNDKYLINEFDINDLNKNEDTAFLQKYKFIADDIIKKIAQINFIKMVKVYKKIKNNEGVYTVKPYCFYFNGFE